MKIGVAGDWHGNMYAVNRVLNFFAAQGVEKILQVGDYGISGLKIGKFYDDNVQRTAERHGQTIYITPGNHEDYTFIRSMEPGPDGWCTLRPNIRVAPRGLRWEWDNRSFVSLGGAASVDRSWRLMRMGVPSPSVLTTRPDEIIEVTKFPIHGAQMWWPEELISLDDVQAVIDGGYADVMVAHDAPYYSALDAYIAGNPFGFKQVDLDYADEARYRMHMAAHGVMPKLFLHGHYHFATDQMKGWATGEGRPGHMKTADLAGITRIVGLNMEDQRNSVAVLDTSDLSVVVSSV